ncbi:MAG: His-Xaa-Ser system radical SAM maturase HxsC [Robiginitomaculum sp.]|nr:His-Xaa-Ser system radical SAM maturase HxsC [Robiginitomaculum sp.]
MINLRLKIIGTFKDLSPFVVKLDKDENFTIQDRNVSVKNENGNFTFMLSDDDVHGDICLVFPETKTLLRQIRSSSTSNTILLTEQCDQACVMCSQPPKNKIYDHYHLYKEALLLAPPDCIIGISGGEPTLEKKNLFPFIFNILEERPDIKFHILTNAQHFEDDDLALLSKINPSILWGVPIYSHDSGTHDEIVGKEGAYTGLLDGINILFKSGALVEIRTIVMEQNINDFPKIADFISRHMPHCETWAIMQLENIGYAKMNWSHIFVDTSKNFAPIENALSIARIKNINTRLYNFPMCTIPKEWQDRSCKSISDWKNKYLDLCDECTMKSKCGGFFDWYNEENGFKKIGAL